MKTKSEFVYKEAQNMFARENTDPKRVFDEQSVVASQRDFPVSAAPTRIRDAYIRQAEASFEAAATARRRTTDAPKGQRDGDAGLVKSAKHWKAYLGV